MEGLGYYHINEINDKVVKRKYKKKLMSVIVCGF